MLLDKNGGREGQAVASHQYQHHWDHAIQRIGKGGRLLVPTAMGAAWLTVVAVLVLLDITQIGSATSRHLDIVVVCIFEPLLLMLVTRLLHVLKGQNVRRFYLDFVINDRVVSNITPNDRRLSPSGRGSSGIEMTDRYTTLSDLDFIDDNPEEDIDLDDISNLVVMFDDLPATFACQLMVHWALHPS